MVAGWHSLTASRDDKGRKSDRVEKVAASFGTESRMKGNDALLALVRAFTAADFPYMVVGSYSSNFFGIPRSTKDADVVVHLPPERWVELPGILPDGIDLDDQMSFEMVTSTRREILRVAGSIFEIELFRLSDDPHDRSRFSRRRKEEIFPGECVYLPTPEDVIVQKLRWAASAKRPKDFSDTVAVMQVQGTGLDWNYIEEWCGKHGTLNLMQEAMSEARSTWRALD
ncbi:MAG: hypothetical protein KF712_12830 [Akkermansiaceae bacterium]|nr:hypothetical protein [Akkermansiaceae bacterium]